MRDWTRRLLALQLGIAVLLVVLGARAGERPAVVVTAVGADVARPGLVEALRIQLAGRADIRAAPALTGATIASSTDAATALAAAEAAKLVVWVERAPDEESVAYLLHIIGDRAGRVLVIVLRVDAADELALDRALSLKVAEVFDAVTLQPPVVAVPRQLDDGDAKKTDGEKPGGSSQDAGLPRIGFVGDVAGWAATGTGDASAQGGVAFSAGARLRAGAFVGELAALGRVVTALDVETEAGRVEASEGGFGAGLRLAGVVSVAALGGEIDIGGRVIDATGTTPAGKSGSGSTVVPFVAVLPQATFSLTSFLALRVGIGVEVSLRRHRFTVNEIPVLDLGTVRGTAGGGFVFSTP